MNEQNNNINSTQPPLNGNQVPLQPIPQTSENTGIPIQDTPRYQNINQESGMTFQASQQSPTLANQVSQNAPLPNQMPQQNPTSLSTNNMGNSHQASNTSSVHDLSSQQVSSIPPYQNTSTAQIQNTNINTNGNNILNHTQDDTNLQQMGQPVADSFRGTPSMTNETIIQPQNTISNIDNSSTQGEIQQIPSSSVDSINQPEITPQAINQNPQMESTSTMPNNGVFAPTTPLGGMMNDATNIGFVASSSEPPKKKKTGVFVAIFLVMLVALGLLGYFVVYPYVLKTYFNNPKNVYETTIKNVFKKMNNTTNDIIHTKGIYDIDITLDSNLEALKDYIGYTYRLNVGIDPEKKLLQSGLSLKNIKEQTEHSYFNYVKDGKQYDNFSTYRGYIYRGEVKDNTNVMGLFETDLNTLFDTSNKLNKEEYEYISNTFSTLLIESIDEEKLTKEDASLSINGETLKVINNKYTIDKATLDKMVNYIKDGMIKDDKFIDILSKNIGMDKDKVIEAIRNIKISMDDENNQVFIQIYTYGNKSEIIGFSVTNNNQDSDLHYYAKDDYFELVFTSKEMNSITEDDSFKVELVGRKNNNATQVTLKVMDKEMLNMQVSQWDEKGIVFDYALTFDEAKYDGTFKYLIDSNEDRSKYILEGSVKTGSEYINLNANVTFDWTSEVANINTDSAVTLNDAEVKQQQDAFIKSLADSPLGKLMTTSNNEFDPSISDYYNNNPSNNGLQGTGGNATNSNWSLG